MSIQLLGDFSSLFPLRAALSQNESRNYKEQVDEDVESDEDEGEDVQHEVRVHR